MAMAERLFSVVIPTCNEGDMLRMTVDSIIERTTYPAFEIVIVDDGSTDGSCDAYRTPGAADGRTRVVDAGGVGIPRARNLGEEHARGDLVVFLDAHCRVSANWLDLFAAALRRRNTAIVGPTFTRLEQAEPKGCGMTWLNHKLEKTWFVPEPTDRPYAVPITPGGCQAFRRDTFQAIGRFDEGFTKFGFQDVEICLRAWLLGYRVMVNPAVEIAHHFRTERNYRVDDSGIVYNFLRLIHTHFDPARVRRCLRAIGAYPDLERELDRLYASDVFALRAEMAAARVRDDRWFFERFVPEETGCELPALAPGSA
jgi:GT2 family glycosyltransferase